MFPKKILLLIIFLLPVTSIAQETNREFYQLKIYDFKDDAQIKVIEDYLKTAYLPALKQQGIKNVGVFKPIADSLKQLFVLVPFASLEELTSLDDLLLKNQEYLQNGAEYIKASAENPPYQRMQVILLEAFQDMPKMKASAIDTPRKDRVYELRSYHAPTEAYLQNKLEMFNEGGEISLFEKLGFNAVFYGEVLAGPEMPNLMYLTTFANQESRDKHWEQFGNSPEWKAMAELPKYQDNVSHIDIHFLYPTDYSDY